MKPEVITATIRDFLALLHPRPASEMDSLMELANLLDRLAMAYHLADDGHPGSNRDADIPSADYNELRHKASLRFPDFGYYNDVGALRSNISATEVTMGDAIDDLADIARDLSEVLWRYEHVDADDAMWHFKFLYRFHWGPHLHNLRRYLHDVMFGA